MMRRIERHVERFTSAPFAQEAPSGPGTGAGVWTLGESESGAGLALDCAGVHEVKPVARAGACAAASQAVALGFALRLAVRRLAALTGVQAGMDAHSAGRPGPLVLWCAPSSLGRELGRLHAPGLAALGLDPARLLSVETAGVAGTLWAMEEALKSGAAALVIGALPEAGLTPARRLSLASLAAATPCLLITSARTPGAAATLSRWRIGLAPSGENLLDPRAPGDFAVSAMVERCRQRIALPLSGPLALEWCDETHRFRSPAALAHRTPRAGTAPAQSG